MFSLFTNCTLHKYNQARATQLQVSIDKHVEDNKVLTITVSELHATTSVLDDSLKEQRMESANTKVITISIVNRQYVSMFDPTIRRRLSKIYQQW